ncbi:MAG TPA: cache domain-containing protein, partial [Acidobacteriota bacterium]
MPAKPKDIKRGISLTWKFFLLTAFIIILLIAGTIWFSSRKATTLANDTIRSGLNETLSAFDSFQRERYTKLKMTNSIIAQDPAIQAYIAEADSLSILDQAQQRQRDLRSDFIVIADPEGTILARTDKPASSGQSVAQVPLIQQASEGDEVVGLWQEGTTLYNAVALPVVTGDSLTAVLAAAYSINNAVAAEMKNLTHSETAFFLMPSKGEAELIATTLAGSQDALTAAFRRNHSNKEPFEFQLGPEKHIGVIRELKNPDGQVLGAFVAFRSVDRELYGFKQFQNSVLVVGLGIMGVAFLISF